MKRTTFVSALLAMVLVATAAFAYWTFTKTIAANAIGTGDLKLETLGGAINAADLYPGGPASVSFMAVKNIGDVPAHVKGFVTNGSGDVAALSGLINVKVTLNPTDGPYSYPSGSRLSESSGALVIFDGPLTDLDDAAAPKLTTLGHEAMPVGWGAAYKIEVSLDASAGNATKNKKMWCDFVWAAGQEGDTSFAGATSFPAN